LKPALICQLPSLVQGISALTLALRRKSEIITNQRELKMKIKNFPGLFEAGLR
jgi:hypothetical protein